jgi:hypothetical protein
MTPLHPNHPTSSSRRFVVIGGPRGELSCRPVGCPMLSDRYRRWQPLFRVNRPITPARIAAAQRAAMRLYRRA